jgi:ATP-dependent RNA helicase RhlE
MAGFKSGKYRVLVATDIASRGIDVNNIELVINYDLPTNTEDYIHRIGRTARAGISGHAISFVSPDQRRDLRDIERLIKKTLPISPVPELPPHRQPKFTPEPQSQPARRSFSKPYRGRPAFGSHRTGHSFHRSHNRGRRG